jgi:acetyl esterase
MAHVEQLTISGVPLLRVGPQKIAAGTPVVLWLHAGKFTDGCAEESLPLAQALAEDAVLLLPDYPLAPASPFPAALDASFALLKWVLDGARTRKVFVGGERAGGNLAAALALRARDEALKGLAGQILLAPLLDPSQNTASMRAAAGCPCAQAWREYLPRSADSLHPYAAPLVASRLGGLVPALVLTGEQDPARDEAEQYAARLLTSGVPTQVLRLHTDDTPVVSASNATTEAVLHVIRSFIGHQSAPRRPAARKPARRATKPVDQTNQAAVPLLQN